VDADDDARTIGARLRQIRYRRDKSLRVVAGLAGMSKSHLSELERGESALDRRSEIVALANALQVAPSELTGMPVPLPTNGDTDAATIEIRRVVQAVVVGAANGQVQTVEQLSARVHAMGDLHQRCAYREMGAALPGLIADLHASIHAGHDDARLLHLAALLTWPGVPGRVTGSPCRSVPLTSRSGGSQRPSKRGTTSGPSRSPRP
jgi:transcriptional regulator with XRE-family HTH domain